MLRIKLKKIVALTLAVSMFTVNANATENIINVKGKQELNEQNKENNNKGINKGEDLENTIVGVEELVDERTQNSSTLLLSNGMKQTTYYSDDIYYEDENGKLEEYNNEFRKLKAEDKKEVVKSVEVDNREKDEYKYVNKEGDSKQYIPKKVSEDTPIVMTKDDYVISFAPKMEEEVDNSLSGKLVNAVLEKEEVENVYEDGNIEEKKVVVVFNDEKEKIDVSYESLIHGVKETIILNEKPKSNIFEFTMSLQDMYAKRNVVGGGLTIYSSSKDEIMGGIEAPFMNDASEGNYSEDIYYELDEMSDEDNVEKDNNDEKTTKYILRMVVDEEYLENAKYPVTIDPTVNWSGSSDLPEAYVLKASANTNYFSNGVKTFSVGKGSQGLFRTYFRVANLAKTVKDKYIDSATLTVVENGDSTKGVNILVKPPKDSFQCKNITWNNQPGGASATLASFKSTAKVNDKHEINLKKWVQNVANGSGDGHNNYGLLFRVENEDKSSYVRFYGCRAASNIPKLKVVYYDAPTAPSSVTAVSATNTSRSYLASGEKLKVSWSGISSHALSYVQYRIAIPKDGADDTVVKYSDSTKIGTAASGNASISVENLSDGKYKAFVRGVDKGNVSGDGKGAVFYIDKTKPVIKSISIDEPTNVNSYSSELPEVDWNVSDKYFSSFQVSVNGAAWRTIGSTSDGDAVISGLVSGKGNSLKFRAVDKSGNISDEKSYTYYYDNQNPTITASISPETNENKMDNSKNNPKLKYKISDSTLKEYEINLNDELIKVSKAEGEIELKGVEEGENIISISAMDKADNEFDKELKYYRDTEKPIVGRVWVIPKTTENNTSSALPIIKWSGFEDDFLSEIQVKVNNGEYKILGLNKEGNGQLPSSDFSKDGKYTLKIRAVDKGENYSDEIKYNYYYDKSEYELESYTPINVYTNEQIGGITILRFSTKCGKYRDDVKYEVYRSETPNVVAGEETYIDSFKAKGAIKILGEEGKRYYYIIRAVKKTKEGIIYSDFSEEIESLSLSKNVIEKRMGENSYYEYSSINTSNGFGKVELSRGNFLYSQEDISLPAPQIPICITRIYNSKSNELSSMGYGWRQSYDMYISELNDKIYFCDESNAIYEFKGKDGKYVCDENVDILAEIDDDVLERNVEKKDEIIKSVELDVYYKITQKNGDIYRFDDSGRLVLIEESNGTFVFINYNNENGKIDTVNTSRGQVAKYKYNEDGLIVEIVVAQESNKSYCYKYAYEEKRMKSAMFVGTEGGKIEYKYDYDDEGKLIDIIDALNNKYEIEYSNEKIYKFIYPNQEFELFSFTDEQEKTEDIISMIKSYNTDLISKEKYHFEKDGRIKKMCDDLGNVYNYRYDEKNKSLLSKTTGEESYYALDEDMIVSKKIESVDSNKYDSKGNIIESKDSFGNITSYSYDYNVDVPDVVKNQPKTVKEVDKDNVIIKNISYEYDLFGNVLKETDYLYNTVSTYVYGDDGEISKSQEAIGKNVKDNTFQSIALLSCDDNTTYNDDGDELTEETTEGTVEMKTVNIYDDYGNVSVSISCYSGDIDNELVTKISEQSNLEKIKEYIKGTDYIVNKYIYDEFMRNIETDEITKKTIKIIEKKYDANGNILESKDEKGRITQNTYDCMNRVVYSEYNVDNDSKITNTSYGYGSVSIYDGYGITQLDNLSVTTSTNEKGEVIGKTYTDANGRVIRDMEEGLFSDYTYDSSGKIHTIYVSGEDETNPDMVEKGKLKVYTYDENGNITATISNPEIDGSTMKIGTDSIVVKNNYDCAGNLISTIDAMGNEKKYKYDSKNRLTDVIENNNTVGKYNYDIFSKGIDGKYKSIEENIKYANGSKYRTIYNGAGQVLSIIDDSDDGSISTSYEYGENGETLKEIFADGTYQTNEYDIYGNQIKETKYLSDNTVDSIIEYKYNDENQIIEEIDKKNDLPYRYTYYEYDDYGRNISVAEVKSKEKPGKDIIEKYKIVYKYNVDDNVEKIMYPCCCSETLKGLKFNYNKNKWVISIDGILPDGNTTKVREYFYYNDGKVKEIKDYNGFLSGDDEYIIRKFKYDDYDRIILMEYSSSKNSVENLEQYVYKYDKNSNITYKKEVFNYLNNKKDEEIEYKYDSNKRLIQSKKQDNISYKTVISNYKYDVMGNKIYECIDEKYTVSEEGKLLKRTKYNYTYNKLNQLNKTDEEEIIYEDTVASTNTYLTTFKYDKRGNLIKSVDAKKGESSFFTYDVDKQLTDVEIVKRDGVKCKQHNEYNGEGQRVTKEDIVISDSKEKKEVTNYYYDGNVPLYLTDENDNVVSQNIIGDTSNVFSTIRYGSGQKEYFYSKDIQGSTMNVLDEKFKCCNSYDYSDFGETSERIDSEIDNEICYTGAIYDKITELYYYNSRYYDSNYGRFLSQDVYKGEIGRASSWNQYGYCEDNPINYVDPTGMWAGTIHREITEAAYKKALKALTKKKHKKRLKKVKLSRLLKYCTYPDEQRNNDEYGKIKYHGHSKFKKVIHKTLTDAKVYANNGKNKQSAKQLGIGLHTIQDYSAHNVKYKKKIKGSRCVADGQFILKDGKIVASEKAQYISEKFITDYNEHKKDIKDGDSVHARTADNPNAYFNGTEWVWVDSKMDNARYKHAIKNSAKYLKCFAKGKTKCAIEY